VFFEPRLGKTKVALDYTGILALKGEVKKVLILAPKIALPVWQSEIQKHYPYRAYCETYTHAWEHDGWPDAPTEFFLAGREETFRRTRDKDGTLLPSPKVTELERWRPDAILIDESHEYKRPGGRSSQDGWHLIRRLRKSNGPQQTPRPYVLLLSGTPSAKGWRDLFAQYRLMDDTILGTSVGDFDEEYCVYGTGPRKYTVLRYKHLSTLKRKIDSHSTTATAQEVGLAGQINFQVIPYQLPPKVRRAYDSLAAEFVASIGGQTITASNAGVKRLRLLQLTSGFLTTPERVQVHSEEVKTARDWLSLVFNQGESIVIYCRFTAEVDAIAAVARGCSFQTVVIDGRTKHSDRVDGIRAFQHSRSRTPRALVFQYQAGSRAIELSAAAEVLFTSLPDGWVDFWQALNRVRGPNQHRPVRITALCATASVDYSVLRSLRAKEDIHRELLKDPKRFLSGG